MIHDAETGFDRLCAKELFAPDKRRKNAEGKWEVTAQGTMSRLQEDFWEQVAKPYGYERPMRHELRAKGYRSPTIPNVANAPSGFKPGSRP